MRAGQGLVAIALATAGLAAAAFAQAPPATITQAPSGAPPASGAPAPQPAPGPSAPSPAAPSPAGPAASANARPTLIPEAGDPVNVDEVVLPEKPVLVLSGTSKWEEGLKTIRGAFATMEAELRRLGIAPAGRPLAVFTQTADDTFQFDAMIPIGPLPIGPPASAPPALPAGMRLGTTPAGKAYRFVHKGAYDDVDSTYETITTYLEVKDIVAKDVFIEEFVNDIADPADTNAEVNIFVQPK